jgi:hypothetical protein
LTTVLTGLAAWLILRMSDSPVLDDLARAWAIIRDLIADVLLAIWHFLGG